MQEKTQILAPELLAILDAKDAQRLHQFCETGHPALTTFVDITGLMIYFTTAKIILGI